MSDRELLEFAAKAAGIYLEWDGNPKDWIPMYYEGKTYHSWNPLEDDADALRLAVKLGLVVDASAGYETVVTFRMPGRIAALIDSCTRRAIVLAAAEVGKTLP